MLKSVKTLLLKFELETVKLELRKFAVDVTGLMGDNNAVSFWLQVRFMKSTMSEAKYEHLSALAFHLLAISSS